MPPHRLLRACALAAAVVISAAPPAVSTWAATPHTQAREPLEVKVGQADGLSRIEFHWAGKTRYTARRQGNDLILRFDRLADPDLSRLTVDPPPFLKTAQARRVGNGLELTLTLAPGADAKTGQADGAISVTLFQAAAPPPPAAPAAPAVAVRADPRPASGVVRLQAEINAGQVLLHFPWKAPLGAAAFRRGDAVWLVFDTEAKLDISDTPAQTSAFKGLKVVNGPGFSAVRVDSPAGTVFKAWADGPAWTLALGPGLQKPAALIRTQRDLDAPVPTLKAGMAGATKTLWVDDPVVGDRLAVVTALSPSKGVGGRRSFVDMALLSSAQGLAIEPAVADLALTVDGEWVRVSRPKGLTLSPASAERLSPSTGLPRPASMPGLIDTVAWSQTGDRGFMGRFNDLQNAAASELSREAAGDKSAGMDARLGLARFLVGSDLSYEAIGVLNYLARHHQEALADPEFRGLRGAARAMVGRYKEAENDFSVPALADDPASSLWRGYIAAKQSDWTTARDGFVHGASAMNQVTPLWQSRFARAYAEAALSLGQLNVASTEVALALAQTNDPLEQLSARLIQARLIEAEGYPKRALAVYDAVGRTPFDGLSTPALMHAAQLRLAQGQIKPDKAAETLGSLRFRWRGDGVELDLVRNLGGLYLSQGHYREALETLRSINSSTNAPQALDIQADLSKAFRNLFLDGLADGMEPVQALALFYDFKQLTPIGADGDLMVRKLARRLVDVDLLDQAAELLKYQVDNRLDGAARGQVATELATLYLMDRKPELTIQTINDSRTTVLPAALQLQRRTLEARAWLALGQNDHALELVGKDKSFDADEIRADVAWRMHDWPKTGGLYEKLLGERWKTPGALSSDEEAKLLRAGIAYSLASDEGALDRLRGHFQPLIDQAHSPEALRVALAGLSGAEASSNDFAKATADADTFSGWVSKMKQRFKDAPSPTSGGKSKVAAADAAAKG